ncbi:hypothetical protein TURU_000330 [Turdus rufiventris]|nr:hypothetical protein TURU_000330 [Turdus rufiventris]
MERIREDRPITIKDDKGNLNRCIADIVSLFITVMDKLRLEIRAMDEVRAQKIPNISVPKFPKASQKSSPKNRKN